LRIEDTDQSRKVEGAVDNLIAALHWAGIEYDEGPRKVGSFGPYIQSERLDIYRHHAQQLVEDSNAYYCFCTTERLEEMRKKLAAENLSQSYDRHCRSLPREESHTRAVAGERHVVRMKMPLDGDLAFEDIVRGNVSFALNLLDDQVLLKSDGFPTYHLAVVVDDHLMQISHVIRGEEWLSSTPKHVLLYKYFGWELPHFAHLPLLLNPDKSKLSKRQGDVAVEDYRSKGFLKEAIVNFAAFLGWNPGGEREIYSIDELVKEFSLERVGKTGAVFNLEKLAWFNEQHLRAKSDTELVSMLRNELATSPFAAKQYSDGYLTGAIAAMRERASFVQDFVVKSPYFFEAPTHYDEEILKRRWKPETPNHLRALALEFSLHEKPSKEEYESALHRIAEKFGLKNADMIHPLRLAVSGMGVGPGLYDILVILGKQETISRIERAVTEIK